MPGTPTESPPGITCDFGRGFPSGPRNMSDAADAGAVSLPSKVVTFFVAGSYSTRNAPPPMPEDSGSTRVSTICAAMAASTAEPPAWSISSPALAA